MTDELQAAMAAHFEKFGQCDGPPYGVPAEIYAEALRKAVATGVPARAEDFEPDDPSALS